MSQKKLRVEAITNELAGSSLYFNPPPKTAGVKSKTASSAASPTPSVPPASLKPPKSNVRLTKHTSKHASLHASPKESTIAAVQESMPVNKGGEPISTHARMLADRQNDYFETIRKSVKKVGREELYVRLTPEEKDELRAVVYQLNELYRRQGGKTSENEVTRIALRLLLEDHKKNGKQSVLSIIEEALNA